MTTPQNKRVTSTYRNVMTETFQTASEEIRSSPDGIRFCHWGVTCLTRVCVKHFHHLHPEVSSARSLIEERLLLEDSGLAALISSPWPRSKALRATGLWAGLRPAPPTVHTQGTCPHAFSRIKVNITSPAGKNTRRPISLYIKNGSRWCKSTWLSGAFTWGRLWTNLWLKQKKDQFNFRRCSVNHNQQGAL